MNLALFDFDDTITTQEVFRPFLSAAIEPRRLALGRVVLMPIVAAYKLGIVSGATARACVVRLGFTGVALTTLDAAGRTFAEQVLPGVIRPEAMARIDWHRSNGDKIVVVSGSLDAYLAYWCNEHKIDLICSSLAHKNGILTGRYSGAQCFGPEKARRVREKYDLSVYPVIYAYGDSEDDLDMISLAHKKYYQWQELHA